MTKHLTDVDQFRPSKLEVIQVLCALATEVGKAHGHQLAHDCFCGHPDRFVVPDQDFRFEVLDFMVEAVREKIARLPSTTEGGPT